MRTDMLSAAIDDGIPLFVLSPHLDDAVLSCGALLTHARRRLPVTIATLFTEGGPPPYTLAARRSLWLAGVSNAEELYTARRAEDRSLMEAMGVAWLHGGMTEALFRRRSCGQLNKRWRADRLLPELGHVYPTYRLHITSGRIRDQDADTLSGVCRFIETLSTPRGRLLLAPLGVGGHVDHVLVRTAVEMSGEDAMYYSEFPYNQRFVLDSAFVRRNGLVESTWDLELESKPELIRAYRTQVDSLFPRRRIPLVPEVYLIPGPRPHHDVVGTTH